MKHLPLVLFTIAAGVVLAFLFYGAKDGSYHLFRAPQWDASKGR